MTVRQALAEGSAALSAAGIDSPGLDSSLLLAHALGISRTLLLASAPNPLDDAPLAMFHSLLERRQAGECTAYILGRKEFFGLEFLVNRSVLVPRPETETLAEAALHIIANGKWPAAKQPLKALDLCTGSGVLAAALKHRLPELELWASDISAQALEIAQANARRLLPSASIHFLQGNLFEALPQQAVFSLIVSNPPYIPSAEIPGLPPEVRSEPILALDGGSDGLDLIRKIISHAGDYLCCGGFLLLEADPRQMKAIAALFKKCGFQNIQCFKDLAGRNRVISGEKNDYEKSSRYTNLHTSPASSIK